MDYREQQSQELEAIEAIYQEEEFDIECADYPNIAIRFYLKSNQDDDEETSNDFDVELLIELPEKYPDVIPKITIEEIDEIFPAERIQKAVEKLEKEATENIGMVMVFTVVSAMQEEVGCLLDDLNKKANAIIEEEKEKVEAIARKKFEGTEVTVETFKAWKAKFDAERNAAIEKKVKEREAALAGKLTGRDLFLKDATLNLSDVALLEESVEIDESLFDAEDLDMDGIDLDDSDDE